MKVGRWRRERMGQNDSHTREVAVVLLLILLFGIYRIFGSAEPELMQTNEVNPDNILIPMAIPADKPPLGSKEDAITTKEQGTSLRGTSPEKLENKPVTPSTDSIKKEHSATELNSGSGDTHVSNPDSSRVEPSSEMNKQVQDALEWRKENDVQKQQNSPNETRQGSSAKHEEPTVEKKSQDSREGTSADKSEEPRVTKPLESVENQVTNSKTTATVQNQVDAAQKQESTKIVAPEGNNEVEDEDADNETDERETRKFDDIKGADGTVEANRVDDDYSDDTELGAVKTNHISSAEDDAKEDNLDEEQEVIVSDERDSEAKEEHETETEG